MLRMKLSALGKKANDIILKLFRRNFDPNHKKNFDLKSASYRAWNGKTNHLTLFHVCYLNISSAMPLEAVLQIRIHRIHMFFGPPGSGSTSQRYGSGYGSCSGSGSFYRHAKLVRKTLIPTILRLFLTFYL